MQRRCLTCEEPLPLLSLYIIMLRFNLLVWHVNVAMLVAHES